VIAAGMSDSPEDDGLLDGAGLVGAGVGAGFHHAAGDGCGVGVAALVTGGTARGLATGFDLRVVGAARFGAFLATARFGAFLAAARFFGATRRLATTRFAADFFFADFFLAVLVARRAVAARRLAAFFMTFFFAVLALARGFRFFAPALFRRLIALAIGFLPSTLRRLDNPSAFRAGNKANSMPLRELATAVQIKIFVCNNNCYGTIRMHQELRFPGRVTATELRNPDFAALARAFGAVGLTIENDADVEPVVERAMRTDKPVVVDGRASLNYLTAWRKLDEMPAYAAARA
jgi:hypothetical protein